MADKLSRHVYGIVVDAVRTPDKRFAIVCYDYGETMRTFHLVLAMLSNLTPTGSHNVRLHRKSIVFPNQTTIVFVNNQNPERYMGQKFDNAHYNYKTERLEYNERNTNS